MIVHIVDNRYPPLKYDWFVLLTLEILKSLLYIYVLELIFLQNTSSVLILTNSDFFNQRLNQLFIGKYKINVLNLTTIIITIVNY